MTRIKINWHSILFYMLFFFVSSCQTTQPSTHAASTPAKKIEKSQTDVKSHEPPPSVQPVPDTLPLVLDSSKPHTPTEKGAIQKFTYKGHDAFAFYPSATDASPQFFSILGSATTSEAAAEICQKYDSEHSWQIPTIGEFRFGVDHGMPLNEMPLGWFGKEKRRLFVAWAVMTMEPVPPCGKIANDLAILSDVSSLDIKSRENYIADFEKALLSLNSRIEGKSERQLRSFYAKNPGLKETIPLIKAAKQKLEAQSFPVVCRLELRAVKSPAVECK